jgi:regulator of protease activity HflC (stomatin/prohibitin superfamily)
MDILNRYRKHLKFVARILILIAAIAWIITIVKWYQESNSFEPINEVVATVITILWALAFGGSKLLDRKQERLADKPTKRHLEDVHQNSPERLQVKNEDDIREPLEVTFRDGVIAKVELSASCQVSAERAPYLLAKFGNYEQAKACLVALIESSSRAVLEKYTLSEVRKTRSEIEKLILDLAHLEAAQIEFTLLAVRLGNMVVL